MVLASVYLRKPCGNLVKSSLWLAGSCTVALVPMPRQHESPSSAPLNSVNEHAYLAAKNMRDIRVTVREILVLLYSYSSSKCQAQTTDDRALSF